MKYKHSSHCSHCRHPSLHKLYKTEKKYGKLDHHLGKHLGHKLESAGREFRSKLGRI